MKYKVSNEVFVPSTPSPHPQPLSPKRGEGSGYFNGLAGSSYSLKPTV